MFTAFVLIRIAPGKERNTYEDLAKIPEVEGIRQVFGEYDVILRVETENFKDFRDIIVDKIRSIDGIAETTTLIAVEEV